MVVLNVRCLIFATLLCVLKCQDIGDGYHCEFATDMCGLTNDDGNWVRNQGPTPTPNTGPSTDHSNDGYYVYMNAAVVGNSGRASMLTETYRPTSNSCLRFWYYMSGKDCGHLTVNVKLQSGSSKTIWSRWFDQGNQWSQGEANILAEESYQIEFYGSNDNAYDSFEGDLALDDIRIDSGSCEQSGDCDFEDGTCLWDSDPSNDFDWSRMKAGDITTSGAPKKDHTLGSSDGYLLLFPVDGSTGSFKRSRVISQQFTSTDVNGRCLEFWYYVSGTPGTITVYVDYGTTFPGEQHYWTLTESSTNDWMSGFVPVNSEVDYKVIIELLSGDEGGGVVAIDDLRFRIGFCGISPSSAYPPADPKTRPTAPPHVPTTYDCDFELGSFCSWTQPAHDDFDWTAIQAKDNAGHGPDIDASEGTGNGWYIYIESEGQTVGDKAQLVSDVISASEQSCITFWYHMYGSHANKLSIYTEAEGTTSTFPIWRRDGGQNDEWSYGSVAFSSTYDFLLIFEAECGSGSHGDIALDGIQYVAGECPIQEHDGIACDFEDPVNSKCSWQQAKDDDFDWVIGTGATRVHEDIGPAYDHTTKTANGHFIYVDASEHYEGEVAAIVSGKHDWKTSSVFKCLEFYYHHWHETGALIIYKQFDFKGKTYRDMYGWTIRTRGDNWAIGSLNVFALYEHPNSQVQVVIETYIGPNDKGDMSYDDMSIVEGRCYYKGNENFEKGLAIWLNDDQNVDKFDWLLATGDSVLGVSGPGVDHTLGTEAGKYVLFDVSGGVKGDNAILKSAPEMLWIVKTLCFGFWYHMSGENIGELRVSLRDISMDPVKDTLLWSLSGPQTSGDSWKEAIIPIPEYPTSTSEIVFEGIRGDGNQGDIAIDDTALYETPCERVLPPEAEPKKKSAASGNVSVIVGVTISVVIAVVVVVAVVTIILNRDRLKLSEKLGALPSVSFRRNVDGTMKLDESFPE